MLDIQVTGMRVTLTRLDNIRTAVSDTQAFLREQAIPILEDEAREIFQTEGFGTWPPLSPAYAAFKLRTVGPKGMLRYSDDYYESMTEGTHGGAERSIRGRELTFGFNPDFFIAKSGVPYPIFHESPNSRLPHRPVVSFLTDRRVVTRLSRAYTDYIENVITTR